MEHRMVNTLGDLIAALDRPGVAEGVLTDLDAALAARIEARAAEVSMSTSDFAAGAVHAFIEQADDDLWFQLMTVIRKSEDPGLSAVQAILRWTVTEPEAEAGGSSHNAR
jgi:hypothetical protein